MSPLSRENIRPPMLRRLPAGDPGTATDPRRGRKTEQVSSPRRYTVSLALRLATASITLLLSLGVAGRAFAQVPAAERSALLNFYSALGGSDWTNKSGWNGAAGTECAWFGVTCNATPRVIRLEFGDNRLGGTLPDLTAFQALRILDVGLSIRPLSGDPLVSGTMPDLSAFPDLQFFDSSYQQLSGPLPSFADLTELVTFSVYANNYLTGPIPDLSGAPNLQYLNLGSLPFLTGALPDISVLTQLDYLELESPLTGSMGTLLANFNGSTFIVSSGDAGPMPNPTGKTNLKVFNVGFGNRTGPIPAISNVPALQELRIGFNEMTGPLPDLSGMQALQVFDAKFNRLSGPATSLGGLSATLTDLNVNRNDLTGTIPSMTGRTSLRNFDVGSNRLSGSLPSLTGLTNLQNFNVSHNQLTGSIPSLTGLTSLQTFYAADNQLSGSLPALTGLIALQTFDVENNNLTGPLPALSGLTALKGFFVNSNACTGSIPALTGLTNLGALWVESNALTGSIPSLSALLAMSSFSTAFNQLSGVMPVPPNTPFSLEAQLCGNDLQSTGSAPADAAWDVASGLTPIGGVPGWLACQGVAALPAPTWMSLVSSLKDSTVGQAVTFSAAVNDGAGPTGTVQFKDGAVNLGPPVSLNGRIAKLATSALAAGTHPITAEYSGDASNSASTSWTVSYLVNGAPSALCGDANDDGTIKASDALMILWSSVGVGVCPLVRCDTDSGGTVTAADALRVLRKAVGLAVVLLCPP